jgi:DNA-binding IclR family transcriptional regulator
VRIGLQQWRILEELQHQRIAPPDDGMTTERLAQLTGRSPSAVRRSVARLERDGLVRRDGALWRVVR